MRPLDPDSPTLVLMGLDPTDGIKAALSQAATDLGCAPTEVAVAVLAAVKGQYRQLAAPRIARQRATERREQQRRLTELTAASA
jgi:hypothetical protein